MLSRDRLQLFDGPETAAKHSGGAAVRRCGGAAVRRCSGATVWQCGGVAVWRHAVYSVRALGKRAKNPRMGKRFAALTAATPHLVKEAAEDGVGDLCHRVALRLLFELILVRRKQPPPRSNSYGNASLQTS